MRLICLHMVNAVLDFRIALASDSSFAIKRSYTPFREIDRHRLVPHSHGIGTHFHQVAIIGYFRWMFMSDY